MEIQAQGTNPLTQWHCLNDIECVQTSIANGADINGKSNDSHEDIVLYRASLMGRVASVEALLNAGINDVNATNFFGEKSLDIAISRAFDSRRYFIFERYITIIGLLRDHGAVLPEAGSELYSKLQALDEMYLDDR